MEQSFQETLAHWAEKKHGDFEDLKPKIRGDGRREASMSAGESYSIRKEREKFDLTKNWSRKPTWMDGWGIKTKLDKSELKERAFTYLTHPRAAAKSGLLTLPALNHRYWEIVADR